MSHPTHSLILEVKSGIEKMGANIQVNSIHSHKNIPLKQYAPSPSTGS